MTPPDRNPNTPPEAAPGPAEPQSGPEAGTPTPNGHTGPQNGQEPPEGQGPHHGGDPASRARREAASYRTRLRETEAERDGLRERVSRYQRAEVEQLVTDRLADPSDLLDSVQLADLLDDDGNIDSAKVGRAVDDLVARKPHYAKSQRPVDFGQGVRSARRSGRPSFGERLKDATRGL